MGNLDVYATVARQFRADSIRVDAVRKLAGSERGRYR
jgi:hypothetical protein